MTRFSGCCVAVLLACLLHVPLSAQDAKPGKKTPEQLQKEFAELLSNSTLVGRWTLDGKEGDTKEDRYSIGKVGKVEGQDDNWIFTGIKYGNKEIPLPLIIKVVFADDTPMMTMDKLTIPNLGTFSFRIIFHGNRYAGTWQHDDHGGHMWGRVEKQKPDDKKNSSLKDRLRQKVTVAYNDEPLGTALEDLGKQLNVTFEIRGDHLKAAGVTLNLRRTVAVEDRPGIIAAHMLIGRDLALLIDERNNVLHLTSTAEYNALARELGLEEPSPVVLKDQLKKRISVEFQKKPVKAAVASIGKQIGVTFEYPQGEPIARRLGEEQSLTYKDEPASAVLRKVLGRGLCLVPVPAQGVVLVVGEHYAEHHGLRPVEWEKLSIPNALKETCVTNFEDLPLHDAIQYSCQQFEVTYSVMDDDLKAEGISLDQTVTLKTHGLTAAEVLHRLLRPAKLCLVLDETRSKVTITTIKAANARGLKIHQLVEPAGTLE